jgi:hypothetical protein
MQLLIDLFDLLGGLAPGHNKVRLGHAARSNANNSVVQWVTTLDKMLEARRLIGTQRFLAITALAAVRRTGQRNFLKTTLEERAEHET